jgi:peptidoglycan hydrolase CwlO-like protein
LSPFPTDFPGVHHGAYPLLFLSLFYLIPRVRKPRHQKTNSRTRKPSWKRKYDTLSKLLEETHQSKQNSLNKVMLFNKQIEKRQSLINTISGEVDQIQGQMELQRTQNISSLSEELKKMKNEYARMIYYAYKNLNAYNRLLFIFSAEDFNQAYRRLLYYQQYSAYRRTQAELIRNAQMNIDRKQKELEETRKKIRPGTFRGDSEKDNLTQENAGKR